jgi:hypothetical protein
MTPSDKLREIADFKQAKKRNNPNGVAVGDIVLLDGDYANHSSVEIVELTSQEMFATVRNGSEGKTWEVMTRRLSKI